MCVCLCVVCATLHNRQVPATYYCKHKRRSTSFCKKLSGRVASLASKVTTQSYILALALSLSLSLSPTAIPAAQGQNSEQNLLSLLYGCIKMLLRTATWSSSLSSSTPNQNILSRLLPLYDITRLAVHFSFTMNVGVKPNDSAVRRWWWRRLSGCRCQRYKLINK